MGDHRANIKLEFTIHDRTYKHEFEWINYFPDDNGMDQRVTDWFSGCWDDAFARYNKIIWKHRDKEYKDRIQYAERAYLKKLKDKYEK